MEQVEPVDKKVEVIIRCIHPNLNWKSQEGPNYSNFHLAMATLVEDFRLKVSSKILSRSVFFKNVIEKDPNVLAKGKAIEIKITARKHQVSVESLIACLDYLDHQSFFEVDINVKTMLSMLVTANFLKITSLENYCVEFVGNNIESNSIVDVSNIAFQVKNLQLLNKAYL